MKPQYMHTKYMSTTFISILVKFTYLSLITLTQEVQKAIGSWPQPEMATTAGSRNAVYHKIMRQQNICTLYVNVNDQCDVDRGNVLTSDARCVNKSFSGPVPNILGCGLSSNLKSLHIHSCNSRFINVQLACLIINLISGTIVFHTRPSYRSC